jgi:tetratricopeptide (TPR) repeat protein
MKKNKSYRSILLLFITSTLCWGFSLPEKSIRSAKLVIPPMINCDFKTAIALTDSIIYTNQADPFPYILKLTILGMRDVDFERTLDSSLFLRTSNHVTTLIDSMEEHDGKSSYSRMLAGFNKSMYSAFFLRNNSFVSGLQCGFDALDLLKEALLLDSTNTEVLFFLGLYDFARAELRTRLWWVLFWYPGDKKQGFERLALCSRKSTITGTAAALSLSEMYVKDQMIDKADSLLSLLEMQFPQSRFVLWTRAKYFETLKEFAKAAKVYEQLATSYEKTIEGRYNYFVTRNKAAHMHISAGQLDSAISVCKGILNEPDLKNYKTVKKDTERLLERTQNVEG